MIAKNSKLIKLYFSCLLRYFLCNNLQVKRALSGETSSRANPLSSDKRFQCADKTKVCSSLEANGQTWIAWNNILWKALFSCSCQGQSARAFHDFQKGKKRKMFCEKISKINSSRKSAHEFLEIHNCHCLRGLFVFIANLELWIMIIEPANERADVSERFDYELKTFHEQELVWNSLTREPVGYRD